MNAKEFLDMLEVLCPQEDRPLVRLGDERPARRQPRFELVYGVGDDVDPYWEEE